MSFESNTKLSQTAALQYSTAQLHQISLLATTCATQTCAHPRCANADACPAQMKNCIKYAKFAILYRICTTPACSARLLPPRKKKHWRAGSASLLLKRLCRRAAMLAAQPRLHCGPIDSSSEWLQRSATTDLPASRAPRSGRGLFKSFTLVGSSMHAAADLACNEICCSGQTEETKISSLREYKDSYVFGEKLDEKDKIHWREDSVQPFAFFLCKSLCIMRFCAESYSIYIFFS